MTDNKLRNILSDLGRPTLRGIRKCPKCGTFNGTRGISCKNKNCNAVFKDSVEKKRPNVVIEAVKVLTGSSSQVYSVKFKEKGPDIRGFVQLPELDPVKSTSDIGIETQNTAFCLIDSCLKSSITTRDGSLSYLNSQPTLTRCPHISASLNSFTEAAPLTLKNSVLNTLPLPNKTRQIIWTLATQSSGPLVQRVSKQNLVVKCKISSRNPLGLLHILFFDTSKNKDKPQLRFQCSCRTNNQLHKITNKIDESKRYCVHFYACLCAFSSDKALSEEFAQYIFLKPTSIEQETGTPPQLDQPLLYPTSPTVQNSSSGDDNQNFTSAIVDEENALQELTNEDVAGVEIMGEVELNLSDSALLEDPSEINAESAQTQLILQDIRFTCIKKNKMELENSLECFTVQVNNDDNSLSSFFPMTDCTVGGLLPSNAPNSETLNLIPTLNSTELKLPPKKINSNILSQKKMNRLNSGSLDENSVSQGFLDWLASVTEKINQTMHYQFPGKADAIKFQVPNNFFECLQQRISMGTNKKRLPNTTVNFVQKDVLPMGTFTKYTWKITNVLQVKNIFDTPLVPLDVTRRFVKNRDGLFEFYYGAKDSTDLANNFSKLGKTPLIKPVEYKTFLKVGIMSGIGMQKEPVPFLIEWVPDVLPQSQMGEMTIMFEYGHLKNGQLVEWTKSNDIDSAPTLIPVVSVEIPKVASSNPRKRKIQPNILGRK